MAEVLFKEDFLKERRRRIALIIKSGFERLVVGT